MSRAYFFGNMYLSPIQQGIQAAHVVGEMAVKYHPDNKLEQGAMFHNWAKNHKVMILLNAGYGENIEELDDLFEGINDHHPDPRLSEFYDGYSPYPFAIFHESDEALGGAATSFGVILPPKIYEGAAVMRKLKRLRRDDSVRMEWDFNKVLSVTVPVEGGYVGETKVEDFAYNDWEIFFMERLGTFRLA